MGKYFWDDPLKPPIGLNADIERHRAAKIDLQTKLAVVDSRTDEMSQAAARQYRHSLAVLEQSLADVVSKLGRPS